MVNKKTALSFIVILQLIILLLVVAGCVPKQKKLAPKRLISEPTISLYLNETGEVKRLKIEEYVEGVVAAEMDTNWPINALAAQAILARTFTLKQIKDKGGVPQHKTDASTSVEEFQAYNPKKANKAVRLAVEMTRGEVVKYKGSYINAWFSACDGGTEASAAEGLSYQQEKTPYIRAGVKDGCLGITVKENKIWNTSFPLNIVRNAVLKVTGKDTGEINSGNVSVAQTGPSGRATLLRIGKTDVNGAALRLALGSDKMRSIFVEKIYVQDGSLIMKGKGYGHGVGMCQWGARGLASKGKSPKDIINFYFRDVRIEKLWK